MALLGEFVQFLFNYPELGWILVIIYLAYELRGERGRIYQLDKKITSAIVVIRALSREGADNVDEKVVDEYLVENGMEPSDFMKNDERDEVSRANVADGSFAARSDGEGQFDLNQVIAEETVKDSHRDDEDKQGT